jgi:hypothetical protein
MDGVLVSNMDGVLVSNMDGAKDGALVGFTVIVIKDVILGFDVGKIEPMVGVNEGLDEIGLYEGFTVNGFIDGFDVRETFGSVVGFVGFDVGFNEGILEGLDVTI